MQLRLCLFWLKRISGNHLTPAWVFGKHRKLGQTEINFRVDRKIPLQSQKWFSVKIFTSNHFWTHAQRERERERERAAFDFASEPRAQITPLTSLIYKPIYEPTNRSSTQSLRPTDLRTREPIFDQEPSTHEPSTLSATQSLRATNRSLSLSLYVILIFCVILIDPRTDLRFCVILIFYFLSFISDFFVVVVVVWVVVFWWFSCCVVMGFVWVVVENSIFRMLPNTWKYFLEQFS